MDCKAAIAALHPYLDGELDRAAVDALESHLERCPACARELAALEALRNTIRAGAPRFSTPASLRERLRSTEEFASAPARLAYAPRQRWLAMAATFVGAFALGAAVMAWRSGEIGADAQVESLSHDLFASHLRALAAASPIDVVSSDRHTVKPWFAGRVGQSPTVRDFASDGFPLLGGRIDYVGQRRVPVLVYGHGKHVIDVFVLPEDTASIGSSITQKQGYRLASVTLDGEPMWIVTDLDEHEFARFVRLLGTMPTPDPSEKAP